MAKNKKKSKWSKLQSQKLSIHSATENDVNDALIEIAKILDLDWCGIGTAYIKEYFGNSTAMAYYDRLDDIIIINPRYLISKDIIYFAIAHELRHRWQNEHNADEWFNNYKLRDTLDLQQYNNQIAEKDANAFALVVMDSLYPGWESRIKIVFQTNKGIKNKIWDEEIQIAYNAIRNQYFNMIKA